MQNKNVTKSSKKNSEEEVVDTSNQNITQEQALNKSKNEAKTEYEEMVKSWLETEDKINALNKSLKDLRDEKKQFENFIIDYMEENDNVEVTIPEGRVRKNVLKSKGGFNEKVIMSGLADITKDDTKVKEITKVIAQKRETKEKKFLKKVKKN
jgi:hypothetical protein